MFFHFLPHHCHSPLQEPIYIHWLTTTGRYQEQMNSKGWSCGYLLSPRLLFIAPIYSMRIKETDTLARISLPTVLFRTLLKERTTLRRGALHRWNPDKAVDCYRSGRNYLSSRTTHCSLFEKLY